MRLTLGTLLFLTCGAAYAHPFEPPVSHRQQEAIRYAALYGSTFDLALTEQALIGNESSYCENSVAYDAVSPDGVSEGCGMLQPTTAAFMAGHPVADEDLVNDDALNIYLAREGSWARGLVCYNRGPAIADTWTEARAGRDRYVRDIRAWIAHIRALPKSMD